MTEEKLKMIVTDRNPYYVGIEDGKEAILEELKEIIEKDIPLKGDIEEKFRKIISEEDSKIEEIAEIWCRWNARKIDGDKAVFEIGNILKEETRSKWREWCKKR